MQLRDVIPQKSTKVVEQQLNEINMSPSSLRQLAGAITGAQAGMEFEMIVPNVNSMDGDGDMEADYDNDDRVSSIDDAASFFDDNEYNSNREITHLREQMNNDYQEWLFTEFDNRWDSDAEEFVYNYVVENLNAADIAEVLGLDEEEAAALEARGPERADYNRAAEKIVADELEPYLNDAREESQSDFYSNADKEDEWLSAEGLRYMSDIEQHYSINWPHYTSMNSGQGESLEDTAKEFEGMIGKDVKWSEKYHGAQRDASSYVVEPDGSLEGDNANDTGLEFVSPPMPIVDMLSDLDKTVKWAGQSGCYTNSSTGLHINVSVPGTENSQNIDYVKLALLLGDNYILEQFGRAGNSYCKSGMSIIKERVAQRPEDAQALLEKMRNGLDAMASKLIHSGQTQKFTSINMKGGYVEFRSPGGDWLEEYSTGKGKIENALLRFVVALDAAVKPELYKQEYLKKLYAMLQPKSKDDTLAYFAKFAAGELPKSALKSFVRQAQLERQNIKSGTPAAKPEDTTPGRFYLVDGNGETLYAMPRDGTLADAREFFTRRFGSDEHIGEYVIRKTSGSGGGYPLVDPAAQPAANPAAAYKQYTVQDRSGYSMLITAASPTAAQNQALSMYPDRFHEVVSSVLYEPRGRAATTPVPGSTVDLQQQRAAQSAGGQQWRIMMGDQQVFTITAATQGEANRAASHWLSQRSPEFNQAHAGQEADVVPVMA